MGEEGGGGGEGEGVVNLQSKQQTNGPFANHPTTPPLLTTIIIPFHSSPASINFHKNRTPITTTGSLETVLLDGEIKAIPLEQGNLPHQEALNPLQITIKVLPPLETNQQHHRIVKLNPKISQQTQKITRSQPPEK